MDKNEKKEQELTGQEKENLVKLSVNLIGALDHIPKNDYLKIIEQLNSKEKIFFEKIYELKKINWNEDTTYETNYCLKNDYSELIETSFGKKKRYLSELIELNAVNDLTALTELKDLKSLKKFRSLIALKPFKGVNGLKEIKTFRSLKSLKKFKDINDFTDSNIVKNLKILKDLEKLIKDKEKKNFKDCLELITLIKKQYIENVKEVRGYNPTIFSKRIQNINMVFQRFTLYPIKLTQSKDFISQKDNLPNIQATVRVPVTISNNDIYYLLIPSQIRDAFSLNSEIKSYFRLGFVGTSTKELVFFKKEKTTPKNRNSNDIKILNNSLLDDFPTETEGAIQSVSFSELNMWYEDIHYTEKDGRCYLQVPQPFIELTKYDLALLSKEAKEKSLPEVPAYSLSYDMFGNLLYSRIFYTDKIIHDNQPFNIAAQSDLSNQDDATVNNLRSQKEYKQIKDDLLGVEEEPLKIVNKPLELADNLLELVNDLSELVNKLSQGKTRITQEETELLKFAKDLSVKDN